MTVEQKTCTWCKGTGQTLGSPCGWCDGTTIQKPSFHGSGGSGEHRSCGPVRAWCHDCSEWCYAPRYELPCQCCAEAKKAAE